MLTWPQLGTLLLLLLLLFSRTCVNIWSLLVIIMGMHPDYTLPPTHETIPFDLIRAVLDQAARSPLKPMAIKLFDRQSLTTPRNTVPALEPGSTEPPTELSATLPEEVLGTYDNVLARLENIWGVQIGGGLIVSHHTFGRCSYYVVRPISRIVRSQIGINTLKWRVISYHCGTPAFNRPDTCPLQHVS
jgi:hypothetical protein